MEFLHLIAKVLWGPWTPWLLFLSGILFTIWSRFTQYMAMTHGFAVVRGVYDRPEDPGAINHFQALSAALSGTVGLGNIGGVALAISLGGPGALFWMWMVALFGMALKTVEITLAMMYRNTDDPDNPHGGAMWVVEKTLGTKGGIWKPVAKVIGIFFSLTLINSALTSSSMFQTWNIATVTEGYFGVPRIGSGIVIAILVGTVIIGGIKRIGHVAAKLVPFMCVLYILSAFAVLARHVGEIPNLLWFIVESAFQTTEATGAFIGGGIGYAFIQGMKRALYSNEAGQGSAPIAHAAAKTDEPAREGIVGGLGPFIDTICICTITALVILSTGTWNREAIGTFGAEITLQKIDGSPVPTWKVVASTERENLPVARLDEWNAGADFFLLAKVEGATRKNNKSNLVKVLGEVIEIQDEKSSEAASLISLQWGEIVLNPGDWEGLPTNLTLVDKSVHREYGGANLTAHAFDREYPGLGKWLVTVASWLFGFSTLISWCYYGEQGIVYLLGNRAVLPYKILFLIGVLYGAAGISGTTHILLVIDIGTGFMLWANLPIVLFLGHLAIKSLSDYGKRLKRGDFHPHAPPPLKEVVEGKDVE